MLIIFIITGSAVIIQGGCLCRTLDPCCQEQLVGTNKTLPVAPGQVSLALLVLSWSPTRCVLQTSWWTALIPYPSCPCAFAPKNNDASAAVTCFGLGGGSSVPPGNFQTPSAANMKMTFDVT